MEETNVQQCCYRVECLFEPENLDDPAVARKARDNKVYVRQRERGRVRMNDRRKERRKEKEKERVK